MTSAALREPLLPVREPLRSRPPRSTGGGRSILVLAAGLALVVLASLAFVDENEQRPIVAKAPLHLGETAVATPSLLKAASISAETPSMADEVSTAIDALLDISDAYLHLGAAFDLVAATPSRGESERSRALLSHVGPQHPPPLAATMYNESLASHDAAVSLANWLNTLGGTYAPDWSQPSAWPIPEARRSLNAISALQDLASAVGQAKANVHHELRQAALSQQDWPTLRCVGESRFHRPLSGLI